MDYSQKPLITLFLQGKFPGETEMPKHIETVISNVFIFNAKAYKVYKHDNDFFNSGFTNFSDKHIRHTFTRDDFTWNNASTPTIYTNVVGVKVVNGKIILTGEENEVEEYVIVMNTVDTSDVLFEKLIHKTLTIEEALSIGKGLGESLQRVRKSKPPAADYYKIFGDRIHDAKSWIASSADHFEDGEIEKYIGFLETYRTVHKAKFQKQLSSEIEYGGDIHSHNALFSNGELFLMDTFSPKAAWLVEHHSTPIYRMATDLWALTGNKELFEAFIKGYEVGSTKKLDRSLDKLLIIYSSLIAVPYLYMLAQNDKEKSSIARKFHDFLKEYFTSVIP